MLMNIKEQNYKEHSEMSYEREFLSYLEDEEYDFFVDIGAAWGYFSIPASFKAKMVLAFEPSDERRELLEKNVKSLQCLNVVTSSHAIGTGSLNLFFGHGMFGPKTGRRPDRNGVIWNSLEEVMEYCRGHTVIKIDVEGNEIDVIKSIGNLEDYHDKVTWLIERHYKEGILGCTEKELFDVMKPYKGELVETRKWTWHYIFRKKDG